MVWTWICGLRFGLIIGDFGVRMLKDFSLKRDVNLHHSRRIMINQVKKVKWIIIYCAPFYWMILATS